MSKKIIYGILILFFAVASIAGYNFYQKIFSRNVIESGNLYIKSTDDFNDLTKKITPFIKDVGNFVWVANRKNFSEPKAGRYIIKDNMTNNELVNMLRSGNQTAVNVSFNNQETIEKFAGRIAEQIEADSITILQMFTDKEFLLANNLTKKSSLQICIPNSYQFYWNVSPKKFRDKLLTEYHRFWNSTRLEKAKKLNMSKSEVITLASIVQKETAKKAERPIVAGLYLNRLKDGWPLQADPTIIYCIKEVKGQDYVVKRVLLVDLEINSPYNTYKYKGLPPSLISMPDIETIDAVLNADKHEYFYMCASIDKIGYHEFAKSLSQHNRNAAKYQNWLNKNGIGR
ncbi:MAG: endolytic transglycosylase MltG [Polaribacter sp.]|uniref:endolytic transglycosylase MltG n=1 Tax=Polaribacter sp. TaxID=1920175 RepID=UPI003BAF0193